MKWCGLFSRLHGTGRDRGAVAIFTALALFFVIPGFAALAVDIGRYMSERQQLQNALDAGALAGAQLLPLEGQEARDTAIEFARKNDPDLEGVDIAVSFGCLVRAAPTDPNSAARTEVLSLCRQFENDVGAFSCQDNGRCYRPCEFTNEGDGCNAITVQAQITVPLILAPIMRGNDMKTLGADLVGSACRGSCGTPPELRLVMLLDRSRSIGRDYEKVQAGAKSVLQSGFVPELHLISLGAFPDLVPNDAQKFIVEGLTNEYERLAGVIDRLPQDGAATDIGSPIEEARLLLLDEARARPDRAINQYMILLTDGVPNQPLNEKPCEYAVNLAAAAKRAGIRLFTIGYRLTDDTCSASDFGGVTAAKLLQAMASGGESAGAPLSNCEAENKDQDDFLCQNAGEDLTEVFNEILIQIFNDLGGSSLVDLSAYRSE